MSDDLTLARKMSDLGYSPQTPVFRIADPNDIAGPGLGSLLRSGGPMKVNVNTAPRQVLEMVFQAKGFLHDAGMLLAARNQKPFASVADIRERHVLSAKAFGAVSGYLTTAPGPTCVCAEVTLEQTHETFVGFVVQEDQRYVIEGFFSTDETFVE